MGKDYCSTFGICFHVIVCPPAWIQCIGWMASKDLCHGKSFSLLLIFLINAMLFYLVSSQLSTIPSSTNSFFSQEMGIMQCDHAKFINITIANTTTFKHSSKPRPQPSPQLDLYLHFSATQLHPGTQTAQAQQVSPWLSSHSSPPHSRIPSL